MAIRFRCQSCSGLMSIASRKAGAMVQCPTCGEQTLVPMEDMFEAEVKSATVPPEVAAPSEFEEHVEFSEIDERMAGGPPALRENEQPPSHVSDDVEAADAGADHPDISDDAKSEFVDEAPGFMLRRKSRTEDEMDLTPMVDVTFQLLIFFMVTASFALQKSIQVPTPDPDQKGATQQLQMMEDLEGTSILVKIDAASAITIDDEPLADSSRLADTLRNKMRKEQKTELLITAHAASLHRAVISVIDAANDVGMQKIRLASRKNE